MLDGRIPPEDLKILDEIVKTLNERKAIYGSARIKTALCKDKDVWKNLVTRVELLHKDEQKSDDRRFEYPNLFLSDSTNSMESVTTLINDVVKKGVLAIKECPAVQIEGNLRTDEHFIDLPSNDDQLKSAWPSNCYFFYPKDSFKCRPPSGPFVSLDQPPFPDAHSAIRSIVGLDVEHYSGLQGAIIFLLPKYEARIREVRLSRKEISIKIFTKEATANEVVGKLYYDKKRGENSGQENIFFDEEKKSIPLEFIPDSTYFYLLSKETGKLLDHRRISLRWPTLQKDVIIEVTTDEIRELIKRGENEVVEFKQEITEEKTKDKFAETVVAFSNTSGGTILIGVNDNCEVVGIRDPRLEEDRARKTLRSRCEPPVEPDITAREIDEKLVLLVQVKEGENKPYTFREKGIFVRSGPNNRIATRDELDEIYSRKSTTLPRRY